MSETSDFYDAPIPSGRLAEKLRARRAAEIRGLLGPATQPVRWLPPISGPTER